MCLVSMVTDWHQRTYPVTHPYWDVSDNHKKFKEILDAVKELDKRLGQPDCVDPKKDEYIKELEARIKRLEDQASKRVAITDQDLFSYIGYTPGSSHSL